MLLRKYVTRYPIALVRRFNIYGQNYLLKGFLLILVPSRVNRESYERTIRYEQKVHIKSDLKYGILGVD